MSDPYGAGRIITGIILNTNKERTNVILGRKNRTLWGRDSIEDKIGAIRYRISPLSFYQVNPYQTRTLYETARSYAELTGEEIVWDLYCGTGTISLFLAPYAKQVYGVEVVPDAIDNARENAKLNHIDNAQFLTGKAEEVLPREYQEHQIYADVIVVDPPRKGLEGGVIDTIAAMAPKRVVYISCNSATPSQPWHRSALSTSAATVRHSPGIWQYLLRKDIRHGKYSQSTCSPRGFTWRQ